MSTITLKCRACGVLLALEKRLPRCPYCAQEPAAWDEILSEHDKYWLKRTLKISPS